MIQIIINGVIVDLPDDFNLKAIEKSSLFSWEMQGGFTLPFSLPKSPTNRKLFGYLDIISIIGNREQYWTAKVKKDGLELFDGTLRIKAVNDNFDCELSIPPGNIPPEIWEKSLRKFDFGSDSFPFTNTVSDLWTCEIPEAEVQDFGEVLQNQNTYQVYLNNVKIFEFVNHDYHSPTDKLFVRANSFVYNFNNELNPSLKLYVSDRGFGLWGLGIIGDAINAAKIVYLVVPIGFPPTVVNEWEMSLVTYPKLEPIVIANYLNKPYSFKTIRNDAFYDKTVNEFWNGKINLIENGILLTNTDVTLTSYTVVPFMKLRYIFEKIAEILGFTVTGNFFQHSNSDKILIYTNISMDLQCEFAFIPFNIHKASINYAEYLPDITLKAFVDNWKARLGVNFLWDYSEKTLSIDFINPIFESNKTNDWRNRLPENVPIEMDGMEYSFKYEDDIYSEFNLIDINRNNLPDFFEGCVRDINEFGSSSVEGQNIRTLLMPQLHVYELYYKNFRPRANGGGVAGMKYEKYYIAKHKGVSPLFNQSGAEVRARIFFEEADYVPVEWQLSFFASNGVKSMLLGKLLAFLKQYRIIEFYTELSVVEIARKDWFVKRSFGIDFYLLEMEYDLAGNEAARVKLLGE